MKKLFLLPACAFLAAGSLLTTSCQTAGGTLGGLGAPQSGASRGAIAGGIIGAAAQILNDKNDVNDIVRGVAIGAIAGGATGAVLDSNKRPAPTYGGDTGYSQPVPQQYPNQQYPNGVYQQQQPQQPNYQQPTHDPYAQYPYGSRTGSPGIVRSPHAPYRMVDVTGFSSGQPVLDPIAKKPFRVP